MVFGIVVDMDYLWNVIASVLGSGMVKNGPVKEKAETTCSNTPWLNIF